MFENQDVDFPTPLFSEERHGKKPILPPLQVQWSPELEKREIQEEEEEEEKEMEIVAAEASSRKSSGHSRKSPKTFDVSHARRFSKLFAH